MLQCNTLRSILCVAVLTTLATTASSETKKIDVKHPYIFMTAADVAAAKKAVANEDWAKRELENVPNARGWGQTQRDLLLWLVAGDEKARDRQKKYLLSYAGQGPGRLPWSDNYLSVIRYDALYSELSAADRKRMEDTFRRNAEWAIKNTRNRTKTNWLPNMQWPRSFSAQMMALATRDEELIRRVFESGNGLKWYLDEYVSDGYFYNEEFGKQTSMVGEILLWCRGVESLGLGKYGFDYVGKGGATVRKYIESIYLVGMGRVDLGTDRPHYAKLTMGDAKGGRFPGYAFQHYIVKGFLADGTGGEDRWYASNMNGRDHKNRKVSKMKLPMWFEVAHATWPKAGFDYFLAQMRRPEQDKYYPSLYWGLDPIDPAEADAPAAPCGVYDERGLVVLRSDQGPTFWESKDAIALGLRLATPYVHHVPDNFSLTGLYAYQRPIYLNRQVSGGYAGTDAGWSNSIRSHCGVMVDNLEPRSIGQIPRPRHAFEKSYKFVAARAAGVYPDVEMTRSLVLTGDYLLDVYALASDRPRHYLWSVHTLGHACPENPAEWTGTRQLVGSVFDLTGEKSFTPGSKQWTVTAYQISAGADPQSGLGKSWFDRRVGVRMTMLGETGTTAYTAIAPATAAAKDRLRRHADEPGGVSILASRTAKRTAFVALHEPYEATFEIRDVQRIAQTDNAVAVAIRGEGWTDVVAVQFADTGRAQPVELEGGRYRLLFHDHLYVRITDAEMKIEGKFLHGHLPFDGDKNNVTVNGKGKKVVVADGIAYVDAKVTKLSGKEAAKPLVSDKPTSGPIAARWFPRRVGLATGGKGTATLTVRNIGQSKTTAKLKIVCPEGITADPAAVEIGGLNGGQEKSVEVTFHGNAENSGVVGTAYVRGDGNGPPVQPAELTVSQGVASVWKQVWPRDFSRIIYAPRYVARYYYMNDVAAAMLLDPTGRDAVSTGRHGGNLPKLYVHGTDEKGRESPQQVKLGGFRAFKPKRQKGGPGGRTFLADMGRHPHGYSSPLEYRFTEEWISVRYRRAKPDQQVCFDWSSPVDNDTPAGRKKYPELMLLGDEKNIAALKPDSRGRGRVDDRRKVRAVFHRPPGLKYGRATLYPEGAEIDGDRVWQPGDKAMAFTFCTAEEFAKIVGLWLGSDAPKVEPWGQGDMH